MTAEAGAAGAGGRLSPPVTFYWSPWYSAQGFLPYAVIGVLLCAFKANRRPAAWSVWVALGVSAGVSLLVVMVMKALIGSARGEICGMVRGIGLGSAGVLLLPWLCACRVRGLRVTGLVAAMAGLMWISLFTATGQEALDARMLIPGVLLPVAASGVALRLALRSCRVEWRPWALFGQLALWNTGLWMLLLLVMAVMEQNLDEILQMQLAAGIASAISFVMMAPALLLGVGVPFYRERLTALAGRLPPRPPPPA